MTNNKNVLELVVYKIVDDKIDHYSEKGIEEFRTFINQFDGLVKVQTYTSDKEKGVFTDLVEWESMDHALKAAEAFKKLEKDPKYAEMLSVFEEIKLFDRFNFLK